MLRGADIFVQSLVDEGVECIFVRQPEQLGLGHAILWAERAVSNEPFAVILADDFLISYQNKTISNLMKAHGFSGKNQLSVMPINFKVWV